MGYAVYFILLSSTDILTNKKARGDHRCPLVPMSGFAKSYVDVLRFGDRSTRCLCVRAGGKCYHARGLAIICPRPNIAHWSLEEHWACERVSFSSAPSQHLIFFLLKCAFHGQRRPPQATTESTPLATKYEMHRVRKKSFSFQVNRSLRGTFDIEWAGLGPSPLWMAHVQKLTNEIYIKKGRHDF